MSTRRIKGSDKKSKANSKASSGIKEENEEMEREYYFPKFWCPLFREIEVGAQKRTTPVALSSISGTYYWSYHFPSPYDYFDCPSEVTYKPNDFTPGHFILSCPLGNNDAILDNISGDIIHFGKKGKFTGLLQVQDPKKNDILSWWDIKKLVWEKNYGDNYEELNGLKVLEVCDDDGNPFIMLKYYLGMGFVGLPEYLDIMAKKKKDGESTPQPLTSAERLRLGIKVPSSEIQARQIARVNIRPEPDAASACVAKGDEEVEKCTTLGADGDNVLERRTHSTGTTKRRASDLDDQEAQRPRKFKTKKA